jgi:WD40 repeat protein
MPSFPTCLLLVSCFSLALLPAAAQADPPVDAYGDPLPAGAVARLGTVRLRHTSAAWSLAFAPDGKTLATAGADGVRLWEVPTWKPRYHLKHGSHAVAFSPDGRLLAAGGLEGRICLWETATGREVRQLGQQLLDGEIYTLAFAPDGKTLASGGRDGHISFDDVATGKHLGMLRVPGRLASVAFAPDSQLLASATTGGKVQVWDVAARLEVVQFRGREMAGIHVVFSPDGRILAAAPHHGGFSLWDVSSGKELRRFEKGSGYVAFSPDGRILAAPDHEAIHFWDAGTAKELPALPWDRREYHRIGFSPDGKYLAVVGGHEPIVNVWDLTSREELTPLPAHRQGIRAVGFAPDRRTLAAVRIGLHRPLTRSLWDLATMREVQQVTGPAGLIDSASYPAGGHRLALAPDGQTLAARGSDHIVHLYDVASSRELRSVKLGTQENVPIALGPGGKRLAHGDGKGGVQLVDTITGKMQPLCRPEDLAALAFSPDGQLLATAGRGPIRLWEVSSGKERPSLAGHGNSGWVRAVVFAPDGRTLASAGPDGKLRVWELATRGQRHIFAAPAAECLAFAGDAERLASGSSDTTVLVWDLTDRLQPMVSELGRRQLEALWADLAGADSQAAHQAIWQLVRHPQQALPFLQEVLQPAVAMTSEQLARLVADLDHEQLKVREKATRVLEDLGAEAEAALVQGLHGQPTLEMRRRLEKLLALVHDGRPPAGQLRGLRAVEVLEHIGTAAARRLLQDLAGGAPMARLTHEARAALERLSQ